MTLKRQYAISTAQSTSNEKVQERIFYAEMFLVDHFWQYISQTE